MTFFCTRYFCRNMFFSESRCFRNSLCSLHFHNQQWSGQGLKAIIPLNIELTNAFEGDHPNPLLINCLWRWSSWSSLLWSLSYMINIILNPNPDTWFLWRWSSWSSLLSSGSSPSFSLPSSGLLSLLSRWFDWRHRSEYILWILLESLLKGWTCVCSGLLCALPRALPLPHIPHARQVKTLSVATLSFLYFLFKGGHIFEEAHRNWGDWDLCQQAPARLHCGPWLRSHVWSILPGERIGRFPWTRHPWVPWGTFRVLHRLKLDDPCHDPPPHCLGRHLLRLHGHQDLLADWLCYCHPPSCLLPVPSQQCWNRRQPLPRLPPPHLPGPRRHQCASCEVGWRNLVRAAQSCGLFSCQDAPSPCRGLRRDCENQICISSPVFILCRISTIRDHLVKTLLLCITRIINKTINQKQVRELFSPQTDMCCIGAAIRLNLTPPRLSVTDISFKHYLTPSLISVGDPVSRVARRNLSSQREALADIKTEVDKNQNVTRRSKHSGAWESVIGLEVHAQVTRIWKEDLWKLKFLPW